MRQVDRKYFGDIQSGRLNSDDSPFVVGANEWVNAENVRTGSTDKGFTGIVESVGGNIEIQSPPSAKAYFLNSEQSVTSGYLQLGTSPSANPSIQAQITNAVSVSFLTDPGDPGVTNIDDGDWNFYCQLSNNKSSTVPIVYLEIYIYPLVGSPYLIATTNSQNITNNSFIQGYTFTARIPQQTVLDTDRFFIKLIGRNIMRNASVTVYPQYNTAPNWYNYAITNIVNYGSFNSYDYTAIGSVEDTENKRILYFLYDNSIFRQDRIVCYYSELDKQYNVLLSSQIINDKYISTYYTDPVISSNISISNKYSNYYQISFDAQSKTITIQDPTLFYGGIVIIDLRIGDKFIVPNSINNNNPFIVTNIQFSPTLVKITVDTPVFTEIVSFDAIVYYNQLSFTSLPFISSLQIGSTIKVINWSTTDLYTIQDVNYTAYAGKYTVYIDENTNNININSNSTIEVSNPIIIYENGMLFNKNSLIHSAKISNGNILSWVDGINNEPRKININSGILGNDSHFNTTEKKYEFPIAFSEISLIKPPPSAAPIVNKIFAAGNVNLIGFKSFEFAFQFIYNDNEITVPGTYSLATRLNTTLDTGQFNAINIAMSFEQNIPSSVKTVNLICRISDGKPAGGDYSAIVYKWEKSIIEQDRQISQHNNNSVELNYIFYNDIAGETLAADDTLRPFDNVPTFSNAHEVSKNRIFLGNNIEGYNTPGETSLSSRISNRFITNLPTMPISAKGIKIGYYRDRGNNWSVCGWYIYVNNVGGQRNGWYRVNNTDNYQGGNANANYPGASLPANVNFSNLIWSAASYSGIAQDVMNRYGRYGAFDSRGGIINDYWASGTATLSGYTNNTYATIANDSKYKLGVVFYDYAMRKCGVCNYSNDQQNYYNVIDSTYITASSVYGVNRSIKPGNILYIGFGLIVPDIIENDIISISSSTHFNGIYIVSSISRKYINSTLSQYELQISNVTIYPRQISNENARVQVLRNKGLEINSPVRDYNYYNGYGQMEWTLNNINHLRQIPEWAYYYSVVKTLNLKTRFLLESNADILTYVLKNPDGTFNYSINRAYISTACAVGINISNISHAGLGYVYSEGDMCTLIFITGEIYRLPVVRQDGNYIHLQMTNLGYLPSKAEFQIYTPYQPSEQEPYYEFSQTFPIRNPGSPIRNFSRLNGIIPSDSYILQRNAPTGISYYANAMSPNDTFWKRWDSDAGKVNIITRLGRTIKDTNITWSDTYVSGSQINGSSTFRLGSETFVSDDCGSITKLQLTSKVQDQGQGSVMLALCNSEINSMYLGETQIADSTGKTQFFSASTNVVSTINILKGNYGCINPESVTQYRGKVYFVDISNGRVVQYSDNGLDAISNIKMSRFWKNWSYKYQGMTSAEIEVFGDRPFIFSIVDSGHDELLISLPKLSDESPKGFLPDYPDTPYPFDILDYQGKTMVYSLGSAAQVYPHWQGAFTFTTENFVTLQNRLFSFKNGNMYEHNQDFQNTFYETYSPSKIMFTSNIMQQVPKIYDNFLVESNLMPDFVYFYNNYPYIQTSDLTDIDFRDVEGIWYASILRNKIVPTATGFTTDGLLTAEVMKNTNMYVETRFSPTSTPLELRLLQLGMSISKGHPSL